MEVVAFQMLVNFRQRYYLGCLYTKSSSLPWEEIMDLLGAGFIQ